MFQTEIANNTKEIEALINKLGSLHDAQLHRLTWEPNTRELHLTVDDLHANFYELEGYEGPIAGQLTFRKINSLKIDLSEMEFSLSIFDIDILEIENSFSLISLTFSPGGIIKFNCKTVEIKELK